MGIELGVNGRQVTSKGKRLIDFVNLCQFCGNTESIILFAVATKTGGRAETNFWHARHLLELSIFENRVCRMRTMSLLGNILCHLLHGSFILLEGQKQKYAHEYVWVNVHTMRSMLCNIFGNTALSIKSG